MTKKCSKMWCLEKVQNVPKCGVSKKCRKWSKMVRNWPKMVRNWPNSGVTVGNGAPDPYHRVPPRSAPCPVPPIPRVPPTPYPGSVLAPAVHAVAGHGSPGFFPIQSPSLNTNLSKTTTFRTTFSGPLFGNVKSGKTAKTDRKRGWISAKVPILTFLLILLILDTFLGHHCFYWFFMVFHCFLVIRFPNGIS